VVVFGATGSQGGAVVQHLLQHHQFHVRAVTRSAVSDKAKKLASTHHGAVEVVEADMDKPDSLRKVIEGAYGVFSVQQSAMIVGYDREVAAGKNVADVSKALGVEHLVYTSVGGADRDTKNIKHFYSKRLVEDHIKSLGVPYTILRPVYFFENLFYQKADIETGTFAIALESNQKLQGIAVSDIGWFAAHAFANPNQWLGKELEIAGDDLTAAEYAKELNAQHFRVPDEKLPNEDWVAMMMWFRSSGYKANIAELRKLHPGLQNFATWAKHHHLGKKQ